jgi:hypothetical protein
MQKETNNNSTEANKADTIDRHDQHGFDFAHFGSGCFGSGIHGGNKQVFENV